MKISVFGLGYVGSVSAGCMAEDGHRVIGVDVNPQKIAQVAAGVSPVLEPGLDKIMRKAVEQGRLTATADSRQAVLASDVSLICVGTPSNGNGSLHLGFLENVCREIGAALAEKTTYHVVVVRSTVLPGTVRDRLVPILEEASGKQAGDDFGVAMNPEFLREGTAVDDYYSPSQVVIGEFDQSSGDTVEVLYEMVDAHKVRTSIETAEMVKYVNNAFHALKVVFANEIGSLSKAHGVDGREVMEIFCRDRRLNISPAYLKPGFAFGGSCLPKDLRALVYQAKIRDVPCPLLAATLESNKQQIARGIQLVEDTGRKNIGILGLSFKAGTDDVRESPVVPLIETLVGRGYHVSLYDEAVDPAKLIGANKSFLERELPHIASLMRSSVEEVVASAEVIVVANGNRAFRDVSSLVRDDQVLIDLVGITRGSNGHANGKSNGNGDGNVALAVQGAYEGIGW